MAITVRRPFMAIAPMGLVACLIAVIAAPPAQAGYPGQLGRIAVDSDFGGLPDDEIFTMPNTGGPPFTQLTFNVLGNAQNDDDPWYSGDGKKIVWEGDTDAGDDEIFIMNSDGSGQTQLTPTSGAGLEEQDPAISWDGKRIVWECDDPVAPNDNEICIMNSDGSGRTQLTLNTTDEQDPVLSRDGKLIYYESDADDPGNTEIWVMNVDGSGQRQLTSGPGFSDDPDVSPDDRRVVFTSDRADQVNGTIDLWVMNADGTGQTKLTSLPSGEIANGPTFSPDGKRIVFELPSPAADDEIGVINADGSGLAPLTADTASEDSPNWQPIPVFCGGQMSTLVGTEGPDTIVGTANADVIAGLGGKDTLSGLNGKDILCGGK